MEAKTLASKRRCWASLKKGRQYREASGRKGTESTW